MLKYEHLYRVTIGDGNALAVEVTCSATPTKLCEPFKFSTNAYPRAANLAVTAISVWPLAGPLLDWEVLI